MLGKLIHFFFGTPNNRFFRPGVRYLAKIPSAFSREIALDQAMDYIRTCHIEGDYCEFGVFRGRTFAAACFLARERQLRMRFWAFDSFEGLPSDEGEFTKGGFQCSQNNFLENVKQCIGDVSNVSVVPGWFSATLIANNPATKGLDKIAVAWVDCDLYESTTPVLEFLTPRLQDGSLIFFDDWFNLKGRPDAGEQKACKEWLDRNPQISLLSYGKFGWHGQSFIVHLTE